MTVFTVEGDGGTARVAFLREGKEAEVPTGITLVEAAARALVNIYAPCGDRGICGKCRVQVLGGDGLTPVNEIERQRLSEEELAEGWRLSCQARVTGECHVRTPNDAMQIALFASSHWVEPKPNVRKIYLELSPPELEDQRPDVTRVRDGLRPFAPSVRFPLGTIQQLPTVLPAQDYRVTCVLVGEDLVAVEPGDTREAVYGVAFDLGTTTVVGALIDLRTGEQVATASGLNAQANYGADVIARSAVVMENEWGQQKMQELAIASCNNILEQLYQASGVDPHQVYEAILVGNTCMNHLFFGLNPVSLSHAPYWPVVSDSLAEEAGRLGFNIHPQAPVRWLPNIAGFVGSDALGVILTAELHTTRSVRLAVDIGTNGEISLGVPGRLLTCSTPAGPAFEGARISCGMRGTFGAIDKVWIGDDVRISVIGKTRPLGICGSGLIDAVAQMLKVGVVDYTGRMLNRARAEAVLPPKIAERVEDTPEGATFRLARGVVLTQRDVRELQLAKGAIASGIAILMKDLGLAAGDLDQVMLAGAFGNYVNPASARAIGMVPNVPLDRIIGIGNAAGVAAQMTLLNLDKRREAFEIPAMAEFVELSNRPDFADEFMASMFFPDPATVEWEEQAPWLQKEPAGAAA